MSDDKRKINRAKAVEICADELFIGKQTKEIAQFLIETYGVSRSSVDKWIKDAKPLVEERRQAIREAQRKADAATVADLAKKHGVELEAVLLEYKKIGFADIRNVFTDTGTMKKVKEWDDATAGAISSVESFEVVADEDSEGVAVTRKLKLWDKKSGLDGLCKLLGYGLPNKQEIPIDDLSSLTITFK